MNEVFLFDVSDFMSVQYEANAFFVLPACFVIFLFCCGYALAVYIAVG